MKREGPSAKSWKIFSSGQRGGRKKEAEREALTKGNIKEQHVFVLLYANYFVESRNHSVMVSTRRCRNNVVDVRTTSSQR